MKNDSWTQACRTRLERLRCRPTGWGYGESGTPYVEPSVLASFAQLAWGAPDKLATDVKTVTDWLATHQLPDGSLGPTASLTNPGWPTAWALWLCQTTHAKTDFCHRAVQWLLQRKGHTYVKPPNCPVGHDTTIPGWPWVHGTHSWVEPTAMAVQALVLSGYANHQRTQDGIALLVDRALPHGGWNVGNTTTRGTELRAQCAPTGLVLCSLATALSASQRRHEQILATIDRAVQFLLLQLPRTRAPQSLSWGVLGLAAWSTQPTGAADWLAASATKALRRHAGPQQLALLLLAANTSQALHVMQVPIRVLPSEPRALGVLP